MIISIESSIKTFKSLRFKAGLNILLADARDETQSGNTRNSAGKTSFVAIVDFLLGANCGRDSLFRSKALAEASFTGRFKFGSNEIQVERSGTDSSKIFIHQGEQMLADVLQTDKKLERPFVSLIDWRRYLGHVCFGVPLTSAGTDFARKNAPTTRSMLKYFFRLPGDGGLNHPERSYENQQRSSWQASMSFMLGLEWRIAQDFQNVRDREKVLETLKRAANGGVIGELVGSVAKIRPKLALAERRVKIRRRDIASFEVLEAYKELSDQASGYGLAMQETSRQLVSLKETLAFLENALETEAPTYDADVKTMYDASGIELPDLALRRFDEVAAFQASIIENRKIHLQSEIDQARRAVTAAEEQLEFAGRSRKRVLISLQGKGAFEDLVELQKGLAKLEAEHASLKERMAAAEVFEGKQTELKLDRIELQRRLQADHTTHTKQLNVIILRIAELIEALYDNREGYFEVSATENGPEFNIHIAGDRGTGIRSMEVFCMDIALFERVHDHLNGPGFLIHDSHIFDGVDARQIMTALLLGQEAAGDHQQYIVTLNSDIFESLSFPEEVEFNNFVLSTRLSDEGDGGGLFGFRFD